jgi:hypothetical protein
MSSVTQSLRIAEECADEDVDQMCLRSERSYLLPNKALRLRKKIWCAFFDPVDIVHAMIISMTASSDRTPDQPE